MSDTKTEERNSKADIFNDSFSTSIFLAGAITLLIFLMLFVWQLCTTFLLSYDSGLIAIGSDLMLRGGLIYRDLHTVMFPGSYFILFLVFSIFGSTQFVCDFMAFATIFGVCVLLLSISRIF